MGDGEHLAEHGAGVPIHVAVSALAVAPARAPGDSGDDQGGRTTPGGRRDPHEGMLARVVPMHAGRHVHAIGDSDVHLQREAAARGPGGTEQPGRVRPRHRAHHACGKV